MFYKSDFVWSSVYVVLLLWCEKLPGSSCNNRISMRIVDEPTNYGWQHQQNYYNSPAEQQGEQLKMRLDPAPFAGPPQFSRVKDLCFSAVLASYKYQLCPFVNVTQYEQTVRWNPFKGVLGVYQGWEIENNTFVAMVMREGDKCGSSARSTRVVFTCGEETKIVSTSEPQTCQYLLNVTTALVCGGDAMLVYPTLSRHLRSRWDELLGQLEHGEITHKGYDKGLREVFIEAGYVVPARPVPDPSSPPSPLGGGGGGRVFPSLLACSAEFKRLQDDVESLKKELAELKLSRTNNASVSANATQVPPLTDSQKTP